MTNYLFANFLKSNQFLEDEATNTETIELPIDTEESDEEVIEESTATPERIEDQLVLDTSKEELVELPVTTNQPNLQYKPNESTVPSTKVETTVAVTTPAQGTQQLSEDKPQNAQTHEHQRIDELFATGTSIDKVQESFRTNEDVVKILPNPVVFPDVSFSQIDKKDKAATAKKLKSTYGLSLQEYSELMRTQQPEFLKAISPDAQSLSYYIMLARPIPRLRFGLSTRDKVITYGDILEESIGSSGVYKANSDSKVGEITIFPSLVSRLPSENSGIPTELGLIRRGQKFTGNASKLTEMTVSDSMRSVFLHEYAHLIHHELKSGRSLVDPQDPQTKDYGLDPEYEEMQEVSRLIEKAYGSSLEYFFESLQEIKDPQIRDIIKPESKTFRDWTLRASVPFSKINELAEKVAAALPDDATLSMGNFPTTYAMTSSSEWFAESFSYYMRDPEAYAKRFPDVARLMARVSSIYMRRLVARDPKFAEAAKKFDVPLKVVPAKLPDTVFEYSHGDRTPTYGVLRSINSMLDFIFSKSTANYSLQQASNIPEDQTTDKYLTDQATTDPIISTPEKQEQLIELPETEELSKEPETLKQENSLKQSEIIPLTPDSSVKTTQPAPTIVDSSTNTIPNTPNTTRVDGSGYFGSSVNPVDQQYSGEMKTPKYDEKEPTELDLRVSDLSKRFNLEKSESNNDHIATFAEVSELPEFKERFKSLTFSVGNSFSPKEAQVIDASLRTSIKGGLAEFEHQTRQQSGAFLRAITPNTDSLAYWLLQGKPVSVRFGLISYPPTQNYPVDPKEVAKRTLEYGGAYYYEDETIALKPMVDQITPAKAGTIGGFRMSVMTGSTVEDQLRDVFYHEYSHALHDEIIRQYDDGRATGEKMVTPGVYAFNAGPENQEKYELGMLGKQITDTYDELRVAALNELMEDPDIAKAMEPVKEKFDQWKAGVLDTDEVQQLANHIVRALGKRQISISSVPSLYSLINRQEWFAENMGLYMRDPIKFREMYPKVGRVMDQVASVYLKRIKAPGMVKRTRALQEKFGIYIR